MTFQCLIVWFRRVLVSTIGKVSYRQVKDLDSNTSFNFGGIYPNKYDNNLLRIPKLGGLVLTISASKYCPIGLAS
jgi:hypothetical protein